MLSKVEDKVMGVIHGACNEKNSLLITPIDLIKMSGVKELSLNKVEKIVSDLSVDGYFDLVYSNRHGETVYCITLTEKGKGYLRGRLVIKRTVIFRLVLSFGLALFSFIIGLILKKIF